MQRKAVQLRQIAPAALLSDMSWSRKVVPCRGDTGQWSSKGLAVPEASSWDLSCICRRQDGLHYVERYSSANNQWVEKALLSHQRFAFGAAYIDEGVYAIGGHTYCNDTLSDDCGTRWAGNQS